MCAAVTASFDRVAAVRMVAHDPATLTRFYVEALGAVAGSVAAIPAAEAALIGAGERGTLHIGAQHLDLDAFAEPGAPYPSDIAANDPCFQHIALVPVDIGAVFGRTAAPCVCPRRPAAPRRSSCATRKAIPSS